MPGVTTGAAARLIMGANIVNPPQGDCIGDGSSVGGDRSFIQALENLDKIGWKNVDIQELVSVLSGQPPMMEVFIENEDTGERFFLCNSATESGERAPVFILGISAIPKVREKPPMSHEEKVDEKRRQARDLGNLQP